MAYIDLIQSLGADYYASFNNTLTAEISPGTETLTSAVARTFTADAPAGLGTTHSVDLTNAPGGAQCIRIASGLPNFSVKQRDFGAAYPAQGQTISFWFKFDYPAGTTAIPTIQFFRASRPGGLQEESVQITSGTISNSPTDANRRIQATNFYGVGDSQVATLIGNITPATFKLEKGKWYHIALVTTFSQTGNAGGQTQPDGYFERALYLDGCLQGQNIVGYVVNGWESNGWGSAANAKIDLLNNTNLNSSFQSRTAHMAIFKKPLTRDEIRQLAWYGKSNTDYTATVNAKNPVYFTRLNNVDKNTAPDTYGTNAATWGQFNDDALAISVNQNSKFDKSWLFEHGGSWAEGGQYATTTTPALLQGIADLQRTGEWSFEFWYKFNYATPSTVSRFMINMGTTGGTNPANGYFDVSLTTGADLTLRLPQKSSTTTYGTVSVTPSASTYVTSDTSAFANAQHALGNRRWKTADGEWHHVVVTFSKTFYGHPTNWYYKVYLDGFPTIQNTLIANGYIDGTGPLTRFLLGAPSNLTVAQAVPFQIEDFAMYNYMLTDDQVRDNYINGMLYQASQTGVVKYFDGTDWQTSSAAKTWNGTAWVDWVKKYYDGSTWVDI